MSVRVIFKCQSEEVCFGPAVARHCHAISQGARSGDARVGVKSPPRNYVLIPDSSAISGTLSITKNKTPKSTIISGAELSAEFIQLLSPLPVLPALSSFLLLLLQYLSPLFTVSLVWSSGCGCQALIRGPRERRNDWFLTRVMWPRRRLSNFIRKLAPRVFGPEHTPIKGRSASTAGLSDPSSRVPKNFDAALRALYIFVVIFCRPTFPSTSSLRL